MKDPVIAEIKIIPIGTTTTSLSRYIAACINVIKQTQDITYQVTAMGTIIQGSIGRVLELAEKMHEVPFTLGVTRVVTTINIDDRRDKPATIESKVKAVTETGHGS